MHRAKVNPICRTNQCIFFAVFVACFVLICLLLDSWTLQVRLLRSSGVGHSHKLTSLIGVPSSCSFLVFLQVVGRALHGARVNCTDPRKSQKAKNPPTACGCSSPRYFSAGKE